VFTSFFLRADIINLHDHPELALNFSCNDQHLDVTMPNSAAEHAVSWELPLLIVLQHASCGVVAHGHCNETHTDACLGHACKIDSDCHSSLICEAGECVHQPDIVFFNVTSSFISSAAFIDDWTKSVKFEGYPLDRDRLNHTLMNDSFEYISISPVHDDDAKTSLSRRSNCHGDKWYIINLSLSI
jgi:hypothetical protein